ncbi:hypothetical protein Salat_1160700 [Sesamum alatum]|uniref:Uncharacterized protein n=1 Tax=Sesamum alatum TaxID=300844 RepID=A0AAE1YEG7_9LAMI|nr:hypothetical protein Salat_1160700 [Sesamum alatum]
MTCISIALFYKYEVIWPTFIPYPRPWLRSEKHPWCDLLASSSSTSISSPSASSKCSSDSNSSESSVTSPSTTSPSSPPKRTETCKRKNHGKGSRSSRSSKRSQARSEKRKAKKVAEEVESLRLIHDVTEWWKGAHKDLHTSACRSAEMEGEKLIADWAISS